MVFCCLFLHTQVILCHAAGEGAQLQLRFGGKTAPLADSGPPIDAMVTIRTCVKDAMSSYGASMVPLGMQSNSTTYTMKDQLQCPHAPYHTYHPFCRYDQLEYYFSFFLRNYANQDGAHAHALRGLLGTWYDR